MTEVCNYLDDFLVAEAPGSSQCTRALSTLLQCLDWLGFPIAREKLEGPTTEITFLGIGINTDALVLRLPGRKLASLKALWKDRRSCRKVELQSLAGKLQHACKVVRPGRSFLRRVFQLLKGTHHAHHHIQTTGPFGRT